MARQGQEVAYDAKNLVIKSMMVIIGMEYPTSKQAQDMGPHNFRESGWLSTGNLEMMKTEPWGTHMCAFPNYSLLRVSERARSMVHASKAQDHPLGYDFDSWRPWADNQLAEVKAEDEDDDMS